MKHFFFAIQFFILLFFGSCNYKKDISELTQLLEDANQTIRYYTSYNQILEAKIENQAEAILGYRSTDNDPFEGTWASSHIEHNSLNNAIYLTIKRIEEGKYLIISVSNNISDIFTFIAVGEIDDEDQLKITTDDGIVLYIYYKGLWVRNHERVLGLSDDKFIEDFGPFIPIEEKFPEWPLRNGQDN